MFTKNGGEFLDCHPVTGIVPGDVVTVQSSRGDIMAKKVLITVGKYYIEIHSTFVLAYSKTRNSRIPRRNSGIPRFTVGHLYLCSYLAIVTPI